MRQVSLDGMVNDGPGADAGIQDHWKEWAWDSTFGTEWHLPIGSSSSSSRGEIPHVLKSDWGTQATPGPYRRHWGLEQWGTRGNESKTSWLLLNQDSEQKEVESAPVGDGEDVVADIQDQIHVWRRRHCSWADGAGVPEGLALNCLLWLCQPWGFICQTHH